eukprot:353408-Chlamydomonas_euryale.AAC.6
MFRLLLPAGTVRVEICDQNPDAPRACTGASDSPLVDAASKGVSSNPYLVPLSWQEQSSSGGQFTDGSKDGPVGPSLPTGHTSSSGISKQAALNQTSAANNQLPPISIVSSPFNQGIPGVSTSVRKLFDTPPPHLLPTPVGSEQQPRVPSQQRTEALEVAIRCLLVQQETLRELSYLGAGGFGRVYQGLWQDGIDVAIKYFDIHGVLQRAVTDFVTELAIMKDLNHPRIVKDLERCVHCPDLHAARTAWTLRVCALPGPASCLRCQDLKGACNAMTLRTSSLRDACTQVSPNNDAQDVDSGRLELGS